MTDPERNIWKNGFYWGFLSGVLGAYIAVFLFLKLI